MNLILAILTMCLIEMVFDFFFNVTGHFFRNLTIKFLWNKKHFV